MSFLGSGLKETFIYPALIDDGMVDIKPFIDALSSKDDTARLNAAVALANVGDAGEDISAAFDALTKALGDPQVSIRKEAVWALYCLAYQGKDIEKAIPALKKCQEDPATKGNATIGVALHLLNKGKKAEAEKFLDVQDAHIQFGAAYAITDYSFIKKERELFEKLLKRLRPGLQDISMQEGIAGSVIAAIQHGKDTNFLANIVLDVLESSNDPLKQAPIQGIMMKVQQAMRR